MLSIYILYVRRLDISKHNVVYKILRKMFRYQTMPVEFLCRFTCSAYNEHSIYSVSKTRSSHLNLLIPTYILKHELAWKSSSKKSIHSVSNWPPKLELERNVTSTFWCLSHYIHAELGHLLAVTTKIPTCEYMQN